MNRRSKILALSVAAVVVGTLGVLGITNALAATAGPIKGLGGKCVDVAGASSANGAHVQLFDCNGTAAQNWTVATSDNTLRALGKCMDVTATATANGAKVRLYACNGTSAQKWKVSGGQLINTGSGKCLDATNRSSANRNQLQIWSCVAGAANQTWTLRGGTSPTANPPSNPNDPNSHPPTAPTQPTGNPPITPSNPPVTPTAVPPPTSTSGGLNKAVAPGGNFDLAVWQLQEPVGSPGSPTTISSSRLKGANGFQDTFFFTDKNDGAMTFWAPEKGVTTPNSHYARSEFREMNANGSAADWSIAGAHRMTATLRVVSVTSNVCVGQIHLGSGGSSTKPLLELYYRPNGDIILGTENSPAGGQTLHPVGNVRVGTKWSYAIAVAGGRINLTVNGSTTSYPIPSSFNPYRQYFKAGSYNQSSSNSTTNGAKVAFYALKVAHS